MKNEWSVHFLQNMKCVEKISRLKKYLSREINLKWTTDFLQNGSLSVQQIYSSKFLIGQCESELSYFLTSSVFSKFNFEINILFR